MQTKEKNKQFNKHNDNLSAILEYPFDFERYIEEQLRQIDDLDERRFAKQILAEGLGRMIRQTEKKYEELERRVYQEIAIPDNCYEVVSTVVKREHYDPTNETLFPVTEADKKEETLRQMLSTEEEYYIGTVFLEADRKMCRRFEERKTFKGTVQGEAETEQLEIHVKKAGRYREVMEQLYKMFQDNHIPWETVNMAYLDKFYDLYLYLPTGQSVMESEEINIDFDDFEEAVRRNIVPLWNIEPVTYESKGFMVPCIDGIYYEHEFALADENSGDGYLIQAREEIMEIRHEEKKIVIKSPKENFQGWSAVRVVQGETIRSLDYNAPVLTNRKQDSFLRKIAGISKIQLLTKTDLFRRIMEMDISDYIEVVDYEIVENGMDYPQEESMNWFVRDELFAMESRKVLLLKFKEKKEGCYLNDSLVWFAVSRMQMEISEYRCVGIIINSHS